MPRQRLDTEMVRRGLAQSREQARRFIMAGEVRVKGVRADKPSMQVTDAHEIALELKSDRFVSRGGLKLDKAMEVFPIDVRSKVAADIGASTGGFTDCMLRRGARKVYAVDVGYGQLDYRLRTDPRVVVMERTNARSLEPGMFDEALEFAAVDVSFISVGLILPPLRACMAKGAQAVVLVKPQFEAGREKVGRRGVVRDRGVHEEVIRETMEHARKPGFYVRGLDFSPVKGPEGNIEFLLFLSVDPPENPVSVQRVAAQAHAQLD